MVAATAWRAEVLSKATVLSRSVTEAARLLQAAGAAALLTDVDGRHHRLAGIDGFLDPTDRSERHDRR